MSLLLTIVSSANRVIRELLELIIVIIYITIIPVIGMIILSYRIAINIACIYDIIWIATAIVVFGIQLDLFAEFEYWLHNELGCK